MSSKAIIRVQGSEQRRGIGHVQHSIQGMLAEARSITRKSSLLPPISASNQPYSDSHLALPASNPNFNNQLNSILQEPALKYRRINRGREHYAVSYRDSSGKGSRGRSRKSRTISIVGEQSMNNLIDKVERELLGKSERKKSGIEPKDARRRRRRLEIIPSDVPKYYLTISEKDIEYGRRSLERQRSKDALKRQESMRLEEPTPKHSIATIQSELSGEQALGLPSITERRRVPLKQRIRSVMLRPHKRELQEGEEQNCRYSKEKGEKSQWQPWQTTVEREEEELPFQPCN